MDKKYVEAKKRVADLKDFYSHFFVYLAVNIILIVVNLLSSPKALWFYWVTIFWGFGVMFHALDVFILKGRFLGKEWEDKKIEEIMDKDK